MSQTTTPHLLTLRQASAEYGPPYRSLRDLVLRGALPVVRLAGTRRLWVQREDLERLIANSTETRERVVSRDQHAVPMDIINEAETRARA